MNHVDGLGADERAHPSDVERDGDGPRAGIEAKPVDEIEPRFARLALEAITGNRAEQDPMPARAQPHREADRGVGAAGPPPVRRQVQNDQRPFGRHTVLASSASTSRHTVSAVISRMHGWSIGHVR